MSAHIKGWQERARTGDDVVRCFIHSKAEIAELRTALAAAHALLSELIDTEGPQPGTAAWADRVRAFLEGVAL